MLEDNKDLIKHLNKGDLNAFEKIYKIYFKGLVTFSGQYVSREEAEEIAQEVMLWVWENREKISNQFSLKSLLYTMTKNKTLNLIAHYKVRRKAYEEIVTTQSEDYELFEGHLDGTIFKAYNTAVKQLPEKFKESFLLNRDNNLTHSEIAKKLNVSNQTINYRISQALKILRNAMKDFLLL